MRSAASKLRSPNSCTLSRHSLGTRQANRPTRTTAVQIVVLGAAALAFLATVGGCSSAAHKDLVLFQQTETAPQGILNFLGGLPVKMLNAAADGRRVAVAELPSNWSLDLAAEREQTMELLVLEGSIAWNGNLLEQHDYAFLPSRAPAPRLATPTGAAKALLFLDPPQATDGHRERLVPKDAVAWRPGVVAQNDTGQQLSLEVKDLLWIESTGQRTWLLRAGPDLSVPWEVHTGVEEGFLLAGDYQLGECLKNGPVVGSYSPGGYFYRPGGIVHSGPDSGTKTHALWLLRTPIRLTVEFVDACDSKKN